MTDRTRFRARARRIRGGASYDADAQAYIAATGELFPDALNALVVGIKAVGLWDDHIGSIKKAIGVPSLAASLIDLRNTAFNGTAVNTPGHSATAGWDFTAASSQYIDSAWANTTTDSKATQNNIHIGLRLRTGGGGGQQSNAFQNGGAAFIGFALISNGTIRFDANANTHATDTANPAAPGHLIGVRPASNSQILYRDSSSVASNSAASLGANPFPIFIGAGNHGGSPAGFYTGRMSMFHAGAALDATQAAALTTLFDAYATAAGET